MISRGEQLHSLLLQLRYIRRHEECLQSNSRRYAFSRATAGRYPGQGAPLAAHPQPSDRTHTRRCAAAETGPPPAQRRTGPLPHPALAAALPHKLRRLCGTHTVGPARGGRAAPGAASHARHTHGAAVARGFSPRSRLPTAHNCMAPHGSARHMHTNASTTALPHSSLQPLVTAAPRAPTPPCLAPSLTPTLCNVRRQVSPQSQCLLLLRWAAWFGP